MVQGLIALLICGMLAMVCVPVLRRTLITRFLYAGFQKALPPLSKTEREAIEAGDVFWEQALFQGRPDWQRLLNYPKPELSTEEQTFLTHQVEQLCDMINDWSVTHCEHDLPAAVWQYLKKEKFFGIIIPKTYGGLGFSALANSTIVQKIATHSLTAAITTMVPNSLGPAELLLAYGSPQQKEYYLPRLAQGIDIPCFALTSKEAGSDAGAIKDFGVICKGEFEGQTIIGIKLTWDKRYITLAPIATVLGLAVKLFDPENLLGNKEELGITLCLIPTKTKGVLFGRRHLPLNQAFMNGPTSGTAVFVPLDCIIGGPKMAGKGWKMMSECLASGRGISLPALSTAAGKLCYRTTGAYACIRQQFHTPLVKFEGVEAVMARMAGYTYLLEATRLFTANAVSMDLRPAVATAITKYHTTEMARQVTNDAMDVHAGRGIMLGPNNYLGRGYESIPISITVEGANILTRNLIIFGQGVIRCHPFLQAEMAALHDKDQKKGLKTFDKLLTKHTGYFFSNLACLLFHTVTGGLFAKTATQSVCRPYIRQLSRMSLALYCVTDVALLLLRGSLKRREQLSARLGDVLSYLYMGSAVIKYHQDFANETADEFYAHWTLILCLYRIQEAFFEFCDNFPNRMVGAMLRRMVFLYGRAYVPPRDTLNQKLVAEMSKPSLFRERLTRHTYIGRSTKQAVFQLELTLTTLLQANEALKKLELAIKEHKISKILSKEAQVLIALEKGLLTAQDAEKINIFEKARLQAIAVDDFTSDDLKG